MIMLKTYIGIKNYWKNLWIIDLFLGIKSDNQCEFFAVRSSIILDGSMSVQVQIYIINKKN